MGKDMVLVNVFIRKKGTEKEKKKGRRKEKIPH
jgi:hypothetical protein